MASGLAHPQWNNADVHDAGVDIAAVCDWYAALGVPWGVRVPTGMPFAVGTHLFHKRLMGLTPARFTAPSAPPELTMRPATSDDLDAVLHVDAVAFDSDPNVERPWLEPHLSWQRATVVLASLDDEPVGTAYSVRSDGWAGPALYVAGTGVLPEARGRGVGAAMTSWLVHRGLADGAGLAHLHPDTDAATRVYARLGFVEVDGFEVFVDLA
jgi:GNAT superfamily N-acetyltransferase